MVESKLFYIRFIFVLILLSFFAADIDAQSKRRKKIKRFNAGAVVGVNLSQLDGDHLQGFSKSGINFGLIGTARLSHRMDFNVELLFSQRGSKSGQLISLGEVERNPLKIHLTYAEVPFLLNVKFKERDKEYRAIFQAGVSFSRLLNSSVSQRDVAFGQVEYTTLQNEFRRNDLNSVVGVSFFLFDNIGLSFRHNYSFVPIYVADVKTDGLSKIRSYHLSFRLFYMLK